jgi:hypothetical protein
MKVIGINRVEMLVSNGQKAADVFADLFNGAHFRLEGGDHSEPIKSYMDWRLGLELVEPTDPDHTLGQMLKARGEGVFTVVFEVESIDAAREHLKQRHYDILFDHDFGPHDDVAVHKQICVSPARTHGLLVMLMERKLKS